MKSRFTVATIVGMSGLLLLGLFVRGFHEDQANAQRVVLESEPGTYGESAGFYAYDEPVAERPATVGAANAVPAYNDHQGLSAPSPQAIVIETKNGPELRGQTVNLAAFQFKSIFGPVSIPVNTIEGLRMSDDPRQPATICLTNGDSLTGVLLTESITMKTAWGAATIGRDHVVSIVTTTEPVKWQQEEGRWRVRAVPPAVEDGEAEQVTPIPDDGLPDQLPPFDPGSGPDHFDLPQTEREQTFPAAGEDEAPPGS